MNREKDGLNAAAVQALLSHRELLEEALGLSENAEGRETHHDWTAEQRRASIQAAQDSAAEALCLALRLEVEDRQFERTAA